MSRRGQCGFEVGDLSQFPTTSIQTPRWTMAVDATAAIHGGQGLHITRDNVAGNGTGAFVQINNTLGTHMFYHQSQVDGTTPFVGVSAGLPKMFWMRIYHRPITMVNSAFNTYHLMALRDGSDTILAGISLEASPQKYRLWFRNSARDFLNVPVASSVYRLEVMYQYTHQISATQWDANAMAWVYDSSGALLAMAGRSVQVTSPVDGDRIEIGYRAAAQGGHAGAGNDVDAYLDDFAANDDLTPSGTSGIHNQSPWAGNCRGLSLPGAGAPTNDAWTGVGDAVNKYANVDAGLSAAALNDADYNLTPAAVGTPKQSHIVANPTIPGSEVVKSGAAIFRHADVLNGFPYYRGGLLEGGSDLEADMSSTGATHYYNTVSIGEAGGAVAWTNAKANGAEIAYRKTTSDATAQHKVTECGVEWEDNDALGDPPTWPNNQPLQGSES